jgi:DNA-binding CsgD family transcriptional regulator
MVRQARTTPLDPGVLAWSRRESGTVDWPSMEEPTRKVPSLPPIELSIMQLIAVGWTMKQIGEELNLPPSTVKCLFGHALDQLGAHDRTEAVRILLHQGLIPEVEPLAGDPSRSGHSLPYRTKAGRASSARPSSNPIMRWIRRRSRSRQSKGLR